MIFTTLALATILRSPDTAALRLNLHKGDAFRTVLRIEQSNPSQVAELGTRFDVLDAKNGVIELQAKISTLSINGKDKTSDLRDVVGDGIVTFNWNEFGARWGGGGRMRTRAVHPELNPILAEAGIYFCNFTRAKVQPGSKWNGSTTASGGCTTGLYELQGFKNEGGKPVAVMSVTNIALFDSQQLTPMKMVVDTRHGVPSLVDYSVRKNDNRSLHITQKLVTIVTR